ncbi:Zn-dependent hydrolase [Limoniibacter endophyticus]|uniref:Zn-dependent hydrolase n=2 Tax=Limoniibacter endophyticus TaxID=1565040 RepID=A0A8J3GH66_9HYPH|nr:Zn-dependent hydrolase [Limoniibacter endophyticus]
MRNTGLSTALVAVLSISVFALPTQAQMPQPPMADDPVPSQCLAMAKAIPGATYANFQLKRAGPLRPQFVSTGDQLVRFTYVGHSTYEIESPEGVVIATDYNGWLGNSMPTIATMNKAHRTHYTDTPDPGIHHVLRGWNPEGGPARHAVTVKDVYVRNVPTDIRRYGEMEADGNSIFIFETAGLCIGHLGHLHHPLTDKHYGAIGRLDVVMVPVDGGLTMSQNRMSELTKRLQSSIVLPMHRNGRSMESFLALLPDFAPEWRDSDTMEVSLRTLPSRPSIVILRGT